MKNLLSLISGFILIIALSGCDFENFFGNGGGDKKGQDEETGILDSGGGETTKSTPEQVRAAIQMAFTIAADSNPKTNLYARFWIEAFQGSPFVIPLDPTILFPAIPKAPKLVPSNEQYIRSLVNSSDPIFESPVLNALRNKAPRLQDTGDCHNTEKKHADASVSEHTLNAEICFSVGNLTKIAPSVLQREILALLLHEALHMGGADEEIAQMWQLHFVQYFTRNFEKPEVVNSNIAINEMNSLISQADILCRQDSTHPMIYLRIGQAYEHLTALPFHTDPSALLIALPFSKHPELVNNYVNSTLAMAQMIYDSLNLGSDNPGKLNESKICDTVSDIRNYGTIVSDNFRAFYFGTNPSICVLPKWPMDIQFLAAQNNSRNSWYVPPLPAQTCDEPRQ